MDNSTTNQNNVADIISDNNEKSQEPANNIIQKAVEKITRQAEKASGQNVPAVAIYHYLLEKCSGDEAFSKLIIVKEKSISKCFSYVTEKAYEAAASQNITANTNGDKPISVGMSSDEIFALVDEYFTLSDEEIKKRSEEAQKLREEARKAADDARKEAEKKKSAEKAKAAKEKEKAKKEKEEKKAKAEEAAKAQMSLFDEEGLDESV